MSRVLVDTSVWTDHFRLRNNALSRLLEQDLVLVHPLVIGEIACGTPPAPRAQTLNALEKLSKSKQVSVAETIAFTERWALFGKGCGLIDMMLLASTVITPGGLLWTLDKRLVALAEQFQVAHTPSPPSLAP